MFAKVFVPSYSGCDTKDMVSRRQLHQEAYRRGNIGFLWIPWHGKSFLSKKNILRHWYKGTFFYHVLMPCEQMPTEVVHWLYFPIRGLCKMQATKMFVSQEWLIAYKHICGKNFLSPKHMNHFNFVRTSCRNKYCIGVLEFATLQLHYFLYPFSSKLFSAWKSDHTWFESLLSLLSVLLKKNLKILFDQLFLYLVRTAIKSPNTKC